jgi:putative endonuclease
MSFQGEIDLVALDKETIVFVEVRSTENEDLARPAASVDSTKQHRLTAAAEAFLQAHSLLGCSARFDVITISWPDLYRSPVVQHWPAAFPAMGRFQMFR